MNWDLVKPWASKLARNGLQMIGASLAAHGFIQDGAGTTAFIGAGMTLAGLFWDWWVASGANQTIALLKKLTGTDTHKNAVIAAQALPTNAAVDTATKSAVVKSVTSAMLLAIALSLFLAGAPVFAQGTPTPKAKPHTVTKTAATQNPLVVLQTFTVDDLNAALADATANNDTAAAACYTALLPIVQSGVANPLPTGFGGFQLLQKARDAKTMLSQLQSPTGPLAKINVACAPLVLDAQNVLIQLGIVSGGVVAVGASGGLALPGLQAILAPLAGL